ncbi:MAG: hypothetical protein AAB594_02525 [Patescibacteria group bacterium]
MSLSGDDEDVSYGWESEMRTRRELIRGNPVGAVVDEIERLQGLSVERVVIEIQALSPAIPFLIHANNAGGVWRADSLAEWLTSKVSEVVGLPKDKMMDGLEGLRTILIRDGGPATREAAVRLCVARLTAVMPALRAFSSPR